MGTTSPDWIRAGAEVVVYCKGGDRTPPTPRRATIDRVSTKSFRLEGMDDRINIDTQESKRFGSAWTGWTYRVVPIDSDEARTVLAKERSLEADHRARAAVEKWRSDRTRGNRLAAITALQSIDDNA